MSAGNERTFIDHLQAKEKEFICPDASNKFYDGITMCNLNDKQCVKESGWDCPYYSKYQEELQKEEDEEKELLSYWD